MIAEFSIIPDVFDQTAYSSHEVCDLRLTQLKDMLLSRGLVRNLRAGGWWQHVESQRDRWHPRAKELLKKLKQQGRLCDSPCSLPESPKDASGWCEEAIASHGKIPVRGIITDDITAAARTDVAIVSAVSKLAQAQWWTKGGCSVELKRTTADYLQILHPLLKHSRSLIFIDPHLNPTELRYRQFPSLVKAMGDGSGGRLVEIHRSDQIASGDKRQTLSAAECRGMFEAALAPIARSAKLQIEVFIWSRFHDRYLISNLMGLIIPYGFDTDGKTTRWARMDRNDSDSVQREFSQAARPRELRHQFSI